MAMVKTATSGLERAIFVPHECAICAHKNQFVVVARVGNRAAQALDHLVTAPSVAMSPAGSNPAGDTSVSAGQMMFIQDR